MSQENLDIVTRALNAAFARPKPDFTTVNELYAPDQIRCGGRVPPQFADESGRFVYRAGRMPSSDLLPFG